MNYGYLYFN